jgi:hypothetical protein
MALTQRPVIGKDCKLYYNSGTHFSPTFVEIKKAINVSATLSKNEADVSARFSGWSLAMGALKTLEITFNYRHIQGTDSVFAALQAAFFAGTPIQFLMLDADFNENGAQGILAFCEIMSMNPGQELESSQELEFTIKPTYKEESSQLIEPMWYVKGTTNTSTTAAPTTTTTAGP